MDKAELKSYLESLGAQFKGNQTKCILCDDSNPSAGIYEKDGKWRYKCFKCGFIGDKTDIEYKTGKKIEVLFKKDVSCEQNKRTEYGTLDDAIRAASRGRTSTGCYKYTNPDTGIIDLCILRFDGLNGKGFSQISSENGRFRIGGLERNPIYNRTRLKGTQRVFVVEGEKCVHAMYEIGLVATTSPGGSMSYNKADWSPLYGKEVFILPDNDEPGRKYANGVKELLQDKCNVAILDTSELETKGDIADVDKDKRLAYIESIMPKAKTDIDDYYDDLLATFDGKNVNISYPWECVTKVTKSLRPSAVTVLCGGSGVSKTYFLFESLIYWQEHNVKWAMLELEESKPYWLNRALAQKCKVEGIADIDWRFENQEAMKTYVLENRDWLSRFAKHIWCGTKEQNENRHIVKWIEDRAKAGYRLLIVDPITARATDNAYRDDHEFLNQIKTIAEKYQISIILATHPTKQAQKNKDGHIIPSIHALAGGSSIERFCACVVWLQYIDEEDVNVYRKGYKFKEKANRVLHILKARDARGNGLKIAFNFEDLKFNELGVIVKG